MYRNTFGGQLSVLQWVRENGCPWDVWTCSHAAGWGHLEVLKWACANGCPWDDYTCSWAANSGHLEVLKWALANDCLWELRSLTTIVKSKEHIVVLEWLRANGYGE